MDYNNINMALENVTTVISTSLPNVAGGAVDNYTYVFILVGGLIGTYLGLMLPFYREKNKYGKEGIDLLFDKDFLKVAGGAFIISIVGTGAIYPQLTAMADSNIGYVASFMSAATFAFAMNIAGNWIKGTNNREAEEQLIVKKAEELRATGRFETVLAKLKGGPLSTAEQKPPKGVIGGEGSVSQPGSS
jgi:hypothetical protein